MHSGSWGIKKDSENCDDLLLRIIFIEFWIFYWEKGMDES
jgi:hypothetical protein